MAVDGVQSSGAAGYGNAVSPFPVAPVAPVPAQRTQAPDGRWIDQRADEIRDRVEISAQGRRRQAGSGAPEALEAAGSPGGKDVKELEKREQDVKAHEQAHLAAGGGVVQGGARYTYEPGPDGKRYVSGGEVQVAVSADASNPSRTLQQAQQARQAALAPADPSPQDRTAAAQAAQMAAQAGQEIARQAEPAAGSSDDRPAIRRSYPQAQGMAAYSRAQAPSVASGVSWIG